MNPHDQWFVRRGASRVGPVSTELLLRGITQGKIPRDSEARRVDQQGWMPLMDVVAAVAAASLEDLSDEAKTIVGESPLVAHGAAAARPHAAPPTEIDPAWYVQDGASKAIGPVATDLLIEGLNAGRVPVSARICAVGSTEWVPLATHPRFAPTVRVVAPPPPPPPVALSAIPQSVSLQPALPVQQVASSFSPGGTPAGAQPQPRSPWKISRTVMAIVGGSVAAVVIGSVVAYAATSGSRAAKAHYDVCLRLVQEGRAKWGSTYTSSSAVSECRMAVNADPDSESGHAAASLLAELAAAQQQAAAARAQQVQAEQETVIASYRAMTATQREAAIYECFGATLAKRCSDSVKSAIIAAATDPTEQAALKALNIKLTPTDVSFDELKKMAETGMKLGQPYRVCAYYYPNDISQFCKYNGKYCEAYLSVDDMFAVDSDEERALYDRRDKTACFEVQMYRDSRLKITAML